MGRTATTLSQLPNEPCWVVILGASQHVPGDGRSKTHPGHGYPEHTLYHLNLEVFVSEEEWRARVTDLTREGKNFRAFAMVPARVESRVDVTINI